MVKYGFLVVCLALTACANGDPNTGTNNFGASGGAGGTGGSGGGDACTCPMPDVYPKAGSRLSPVAEAAEDGSTWIVPNLWRDNQMNDETCSFTALPTGETRCLPEHVVSDYYQDSGCTLPIVRQKMCEEKPHHVRVDYFDFTQMNQCGSPVKSSGFFDVGSEFVPTNTYVFEHAPDGYCSPNVSVKTGDKFYNLTPALPLFAYASTLP